MSDNFLLDCETFNVVFASSRFLERNETASGNSHVELCPLFDCCEESQTCNFVSATHRNNETANKTSEEQLQIRVEFPAETINVVRCIKLKTGKSYFVIIGSLFIGCLNPIP